MTARNNINNLVMADIKVSLLFGEAQLWRILNLYQCGDWLDVIGGTIFPTVRTTACRSVSVHCQIKKIVYKICTGNFVLRCL